MWVQVAGHRMLRAPEVIAKLERVLESSLGEVEQAQQAQLEAERLRTQVRKQNCDT